MVAEAENEKYYCEPADNKNLPIKLGDNIYQYDVNTYDDIDVSYDDIDVSKKHFKCRDSGRWSNGKY